jgi:hypothetical protein
MFANPFFRLKFGRFEATVHRVPVAHPSMLKQGLQIRWSVGNSSNVWGNLWHIAAVTVQYANRLEDRS